MDARPFSFERTRSPADATTAAAPRSGSAAQCAARPRDAALLALLASLDAAGYDFATPTPNTHRRLLLRRGRARAGDLADVFGWSRRFRTGEIDARLVELLSAGDALERRKGWLRSRLRAARAGGHLFLHSGFPVRDDDHVFFGPDSYRFVDFIRAELAGIRPGAEIADIGAGAGVGGVFAASQVPGAQLLMTDVNPKALELARINAAFAGLTPRLECCEGLPADAGPFDLIVANPPYISGSGLLYSDGGDALGADLTTIWAKIAVSRLSGGGRLLLYSGSAIVDGQDALRAALSKVAAEAGCAFSYRELDPDVFAATLLHHSYWRAERIAAVGAVMTKPFA